MYKDRKYECIRYGVNQVRPSASRRVPAIEHILETPRAFGQHALIVNLYGHNVETARTHALNRVRIAVFLDQYSLLRINGIPVFVPLLSQGLDDLGETVSRAACQDDLGPAAIRDIGVQVLGGELADELVEWRVSLSGTILQSRVEVNLAQRIACS